MPLSRRCSGLHTLCPLQVEQIWLCKLSYATCTTVNMNTVELIYKCPSASRRAPRTRRASSHVSASRRAPRTRRDRPTIGYQDRPKFVPSNVGDQELPDQLFEPWLSPSPSPSLTVLSRHHIMQDDCVAQTLKYAAGPVAPGFRLEAAIIQWMLN